MIQHCLEVDECDRFFLAGTLPAAIPMPELHPHNPFDIRETTSRMLKGQEEAYQRFYEAYCDRLFHYILVLTQNDEAFAREVLQNSMIRIARYIKRFESEKVFWGWLTKIARTALIDIVRKQKKDQYLVELTPHLAVVDNAPFPDGEAPLLEALDKSLLELEEEERKMIQATYFEGASYQSLALTNSTTPKAIESKLARIRQKLRKCILTKLKYE